MSYAIPCPNCGDGLWCNICGAPYEGEPEDPRVSVLEGERDRAREALKSIVAYSAPPHPHKGCGIDACLGCLIEGTARAALESLSGGGE